VNYVLNVKVAGRDLTCDSVGQTHLIPETDVTFECPDIKHICPNMACPANCAGHGICDFSPSNPVCKCFDEADSTVGCFKSFSNIPPETGWNDSVRQASNSSRITAISKQVGLLLHFVLTVTWLIK